MQEMGISASDAPTSGVTQVPICLWFTAPELGHPTHWWARSFVDIYPDTMTWTTKMTRCDISAPPMRHQNVGPHNAGGL